MRKQFGIGRDKTVDGPRIIRLACGTVLLLGGLFCAWQTWLIAGEDSAIEQVHSAQDRAVQALSSVFASERTAAQQAVSQIDPAKALADPVATAATVKARLPQVLAVEFYTAGLDEVLQANYHDFGYAKAAQLMAAENAEDGPQLRSFVHAAGDRRLSLVVPLGPPTRVQAWAWLELPFAPVQQGFMAVSPGGGRLDLQQGDDRGDLRLLYNGSATAQIEVVGKPVPGSNLSVAAALPEAFIVLPRQWLVGALLALFGVGSGIYLLWLRVRLAPRASVQIEEEVQQEDIVPVEVPRARPTPEPANPPAPAAKLSSASTASIDPTIFRAYDVRGVVGQSLTREVARLLGQAIGSLMREQGLHEMVVGRDGRLSGPELAGALTEGLRDVGIDVIDIGAVPTPIVYYAAYRFNTGCGVAVTGSHNPPDYNGFKIVVGGETLSEGAIQDLYRRMVGGAHDNTDQGRGGQGKLRTVDVVPDYVERIVSDVQAGRRLKIVVDCGNGIAGAVAPQALEGIGCEVIPLYCEVDGTFPNHHPDPSDPHNLEDLILAVKQTGADLGLAFDGDGDRLGVVTRAGEIVFPDRVLMLFARDVLSREPGATIIYDVKCTGHLKGQVLDAGGSPLMWRTGHSLIKRKMRETDAALAGEMSGHFFFKERWYGFDDGIYAGARLLEILSSDPAERTPEEIFATCPKGVSTPELKVEMAEGEHYRFMEKFSATAKFEDASLITIDGVRADWPDGWGLVRASNTTPVLVLRFDADNPAALERIKKIFRTQLLAVDPSLKLPF